MDEFFAHGLFRDVDVVISFWVDIIPLNANPDKAKRRTKVQHGFHRDNKTYGHTTIDGLGKIGKLRKKKRNG